MIPPEVIAALLRIISVPDVPTEQSQTKLSAESVILPHVAVPDASASSSSVIDENVKTPAAAAGAAGSENVSVPSRFVAVPPVAGLVPS